MKKHSKMLMCISLVFTSFPPPALLYHTHSNEHDATLYLLLSHSTRLRWGKVKYWKMSKVTWRLKLNMFICQVTFLAEPLSFLACRTSRHHERSDIMRRNVLQFIHIPLNNIVCYPRKHEPDRTIRPARHWYIIHITCAFQQLHTYRYLNANVFHSGFPKPYQVFHNLFLNLSK